MKKVLIFIAFLLLPSVTIKALDPVSCAFRHTAGGTVQVEVQLIDFSNTANVYPGSGNQLIGDLSANSNGIITFKIGDGDANWTAITAASVTNNYMLAVYGDGSVVGFYRLDELQVEQSAWAEAIVAATFTTTGGVTSNAEGDYSSDDFVFGSPLLADDGILDHDKRFFFDKSKAAFRVGIARSNQWNNSNIGNYSFAAGHDNTASGEYSAISGGNDNTASANYTTIGGGTENSVSQDYCTIGGGIQNNASDFTSTIAGGGGNVASAVGTSIVGGISNRASGEYSTVLGGQGNRANGDYNLVFGNYLQPTTTEDYRVYFFDADDNGMLAINREDADYPIHVGTNAFNGNGAHLTVGGNWTNTSSITKKDRFEDLESKDILNSISQLDIKKWSYINTNEYHIGPFAEDFYRIFGTGDLNNKNANQYLSTGDVAGVSLRGVQVLIDENKVLKHKLETLEKDNAEMKVMINEIMKKIND